MMSRPIVPGPRELIRIKSVECTPTRRLSGESGKYRSDEFTIGSAYLMQTVDIVAPDVIHTWHV